MKGVKEFGSFFLAPGIFTISGRFLQHEMCLWSFLSESAECYCLVSGYRIAVLTLRLLMSYIYIYMEHLFLMFLDHTRRRSTVGRTPLDE